MGNIWPPIQHSIYRMDRLYRTAKLHTQVPERSVAISLEWTHIILFNIENIGRGIISHSERYSRQTTRTLVADVSEKSNSFAMQKVSAGSHNETLFNLNISITAALWLYPMFGTFIRVRTFVLQLRGNQWGPKQTGGSVPCGSIYTTEFPWNNCNCVEMKWFKAEVWLTMNKKAILGYIHPRCDPSELRSISKMSRVKRVINFRILIISLTVKNFQITASIVWKWSLSPHPMHKGSREAEWWGRTMCALQLGRLNTDGHQLIQQFVIRSELTIVVQVSRCIQLSLHIWSQSMVVDKSLHRETLFTHSRNSVLFVGLFSNDAEKGDETAFPQPPVCPVGPSGCTEYHRSVTSYQLILRLLFGCFVVVFSLFAR